MRVLFVYPDLNIDVKWQGHYYEGIASLSAVLKSKGHHVELVHIYNLSKEKEIAEKLSAPFDLVAFSSTTPMFPFVRHSSKAIKERFGNVPLLCGGAHATSAPGEILNNSDIDYVCVGEGENFILEFMEYLQGIRAKRDVRNLAYRAEGGEVVINELHPPIDPLDELPFPDRGLFDLQHRDATSAAVSAGRGCPYQCAYCSNNYLNELYKNKFLRFRKPETVIREIGFLLKRYPSVKQMAFMDDVFIVNKDWLEEFCTSYRNSFSLPFFALAHPAAITDEKIKLLKEAGCNEIGFGIQSGNEFIRNDIMRRYVTNERIRGSVGIIKKYKIKILVDVIFGVPLEEKAHMLDTIKICAENKVDAKSHIFYPLPNTKLEQMALEKGLFDKDTYGEDYHSRTILKYSKLHKATVLFFHRYSKSLISVYKVFGYSLPVFFSRRASFFILDNILCSDLVIGFVMSARSTLISLRSFVRRHCGITEYRLRQLGN